MWKPEHRRAADRHGLRCPSDLSDSEWTLIEPAIPPAKRGGCRREVKVRELPLERIHHALYIETREREGPEASPTAAIIDSQSAKAAQKGAPRSTAGPRFGQEGHWAQAQYPCRCTRPSAERRRSSQRYSGSRRRGWFSIAALAASCLIERIFADAGYQGPRAAQATASTGSWVFEIVKRNELHKFVVLPKHWIVERTLAWISRNRRLARDFERYSRTVAAFVRLAMIRIMLRRLTRPCHST